MRKTHQFLKLVSVLFFVIGLCTIPISAFADNAKAKLVESMICDWSYDHTSCVEDFFYDDNGRLSFCEYSGGGVPPVR